MHTKKISPGESGALEKVSGVRCQPAAGLNSEPQNFFYDQAGHSQPEAALTPEFIYP